MEKILVVEDEKSVRQNLKELLTFEGYECQMAENGLEALNYLANSKPDLIISDIMMPYVDGYQLYEKVKSNANTQIIPFIFLTAKIDHDSRRLGMGMGADDYITKPYKIKDLMSAVKTRISKKLIIENSLENLRNNIALYVPHELRTPLVSILGYSDILLAELKSMETEEILEMISDIKKSGLRLHERIEKFVQYTQLHTESIEIVSDANQCSNYVNPSEINCADELKEYHDCISRINDISINFDDSFISISEEHFKIMIKELLSNACKFSPINSEINVTGKNVKNNYEITVSDKGCGIPVDSIEKIKVFEQFDRKKYQQIGNGLGLSIVKLLCSKYKVKFEIKNVPQNSTCVKLSFDVGNIS